MYRMLRPRNSCVAIVVMCLCLSVLGSRSSEIGVYRNKHLIHPEHRIEDISPRIIGGEDAPPHAYPFQVSIFSLKDDDLGICGGSLISPNVVLTAAHCLQHGPVKVTVILGGHLLAVDEWGKTMKMSSYDYVVHWWWDPDILQYDIALIRLPENVTFSKYIQPVKLATGSNTYEGESATIIGWGATEMGGSRIAGPLKRVNTTIISNDDCFVAQAIYQRTLTPSHICTSGAGPVGACFGDSGGPLVVDGVQVGIVSFGLGQCITGAPSVFTRVSAFSDWIARGHANTLSGQLKTVALIALGSSNFFS